MKIEADSRVTFPRELVFSTYRDRLPELVPFLPNITAIDVKEREDAPGGEEGISRLLNLWRAEGEIPKVATALIKPEMVAWLDHARWDANEWTCEWRVEPKFFTDNVQCQGKNRFVADGDTTVLELRGNLDIDLKGVKGVPSFLAKRIAPQVEKFIVALLTPNLIRVSDGLQGFLTAEAKKS